MNAEPLAELAAFLNAGGPVLWCIALTLVAMWVLLAERLLFYRFQRPRERRALLQRWIDVGWLPTGHLHHIRREFISEQRLRLNRFMPTIRVLIMICPLLGLLGTVLGMIHVFDAITLGGGQSTRLLSAGVAQATLPTMAGMASALSGLLAFGYLRRRGALERSWCEQHLPIQDVMEAPADA